MDDKLAAYRRAEGPVPDRYWLWPLYGAGIEALGRDGRPIQVDMPRCGPDQLLVRHDAVGLCFSDTKVIQAGGTHPRLMGRDLRVEPVVLGHEVSMTVMQVGENLCDRFHRGERYIIQADIYYRGVGLAYGYALQGGLSQYNLIGPEVLDGDEGCYLLPVRPETGYAQAALTEPWACVVASYSIVYRTGWEGGGAVLIVAGPGATGDYTLGEPYASGQPPALVVTVGVGGRLAEELAERAARDGFRLVRLEVPSPQPSPRVRGEGAKTAPESSRPVRGEGAVEPSSQPSPRVGVGMEWIRAAAGRETFDDVVLLGADPATYEALEPLAGRRAVINLVGDAALTEPAHVDVGRLHYDVLSLVGTPESTIAAAYQPVRTDLVPGGRAAFLGAAGPMGQMHVQRALQLDNGPSLLVATDLVPERLAVIGTKFAQLIAARRGVTEVVLRTPDGQSPQAFNEGLMALTGGAGYDDMVVLAPSAGVIAGAVPMMARGGVMNIFAGLARGTKAPIDLRRVVRDGIRFTGTSGSGISDLRAMLAATEEGRLDPNLSVAAIAGLGDAKRGLAGVMSQAYPGKIVIYPQVPDFPLTSLDELASVLPSVHALLGPQNAWTNEAEAQFLREMLPR